MDEGSVKISVKGTAFCTSSSSAKEVAIWTVAVSPSALTVTLSHVRLRALRIRVISSCTASGRSSPALQFADCAARRLARWDVSA